MQISATVFSRAVDYVVWLGLPERDLSESNFLAMTQPLLSPCLGAAYETLHSPSNLAK